MALQLRPNCECCDIDLPPDSEDAWICSYECTFCTKCVETKLCNVCPNCGGGFTPRPIRPAQEWVRGTSLRHDPASTTRVHLRYTAEEVAALSKRLRDTAPALR